MPSFTVLPCCRRSGVKGAETLVIETATGQQITLQSSPGAVLIEDGNGNSVRMDASGISITAAAKVTINAAQVAISAGEVTVDAGLTTFSGVVQAETVQANTVIATTFTPGAGNVW